MKHTYDEEYFLRGQETGRSNYTNYRWLPELTIPLAERIKKVVGMSGGQFVLDYGCGRGYLVRALREIGMNAFGVDVSQWAIENCDESVRQFVSSDCSESNMCKRMFHWIVCKDVLEHIEPAALVETVKMFIRVMRRGAFIIVPLADPATLDYVAPQDRSDPTHVIRWTMHGWLAFFQSVIDEMKEDVVASGSYRVRGIKQLADPHPKSTGFFSLRRL